MSYFKIKHLIFSSVLVLGLSSLRTLSASQNCGEVLVQVNSGQALAEETEKSEAVQESHERISREELEKRIATYRELRIEDEKELEDNEDLDDEVDEADEEYDVLEEFDKLMELIGSETVFNEHRELLSNFLVEELTYEAFRIAEDSKQNEHSTKVSTIISKIEDLEFVEATPHLLVYAWVTKKKVLKHKIMRVIDSFDDEAYPYIATALTYRSQRASPESQGKKRIRKLITGYNTALNLKWFVAYFTDNWYIIFLPSIKETKKAHQFELDLLSIIEDDGINAESLLPTVAWVGLHHPDQEVKTKAYEIFKSIQNDLQK